MSLPTVFTSVLLPLAQRKKTADPDALDVIIESFRGAGIRTIEDMGPLPLTVLLVMSLVSAQFVSYLYVTFYASRATGSQIHRAFPLLSVSITGIFICIQFSLPLSLGLLGALSIIRFRTPVKEPEETGFLMLVIATSLCCATFNLMFLGILLSVAVVGLLLRSKLGGKRTDSNDGLLSVVLSRSEHTASGSAMLSLLEDSLPGGHVDGVVEGDDEATITFRFRRMEPGTLGELRSAIAGLAPNARTNVYYLRAGSV